MVLPSRPEERQMQPIPTPESTAEAAMIRRDTARLLILDPADRLLLICYEAARDVDSARPGLRRFWYTPGGGLEAGESHKEAARRELAEETGITDAEIGAHVANWDAPLTLFRLKAFTCARFFLVRAKSDALDLSQLPATENDPVLDVRWFTLADLKTCREPIIPSGVVPLMEALIAGHIPDAPVRLGCPLASA